MTNKSTKNYLGKCEFYIHAQLINNTQSFSRFYKCKYVTKTDTIPEELGELRIQKL